MTPLHSSWTAGLIASAVVATTGVAQAVASCSVRSEPARRLELPDGRIVSVDVKSVASSGGSVMALGHLAYVFPGNAHRTTPPSMTDSVIGVLVDARGTVSMVANPAYPQRASFPRVAPGRNGSFHVIFATGRDSVPVFPAPHDTVAVWYAQYANGQWSAMERVAQVGGARLSQDLSKDLLVRDNELSFAVPVRDLRSPESLGGAVVFRRRAGVWTADTLRTADVPGSIRLAHARELLLVLFTQALRERGDDMLLATLDTTWTGPRRIAGDGVRGMVAPAILPVAGGFVVAWNTWLGTSAANTRLEWLHLDSNARVTMRPPIDSGASTYPFEMVVLNGRHPAWFYHARPYDSGIAIVTASGIETVRHADVQVPFANPTAGIADLGEDRFLAFTLKTAGVDREPMVASFTTIIEIRCPNPG